MIRKGDEYWESLKDGREIYISGERVQDVTTHPMFKPLVDIRARIYDMQHDTATSEWVHQKKPKMIDTIQGTFLGTTATEVRA
jgi:aromatic ring hydroxylase